MTTIMTVQCPLVLVQVVGCMSHKTTTKQKNLEQPIVETRVERQQRTCAGHLRLHLQAKFAPRSNYAICQKLGSGLGIG
jgi:hypothetical protein